MSTIIPVRPAGEQLPMRDYTAALLSRAAAEETIPAARLEAIRLALYQNAAEYAAAYTQNRCSTVTKDQAEGFFRAVLYQLDAALLPLHSDSAALAALRDTDLSVLQQTGQRNILNAYEEAKAAFRRAYPLTKPFETVFFRELLKSFAAFCTQYDARFQADAVTLNEAYPLLCRQSIPVGGVLGADFYYTALLHEGELLAAFPADEVRTMLKVYAQRYLTAPEMIADNLAELVLLQWFGAALCGGTALTMHLPEGAADRLNDRYRFSTPDALCADLQSVLSQSPLAGMTGVYGYVYPLLGQLAAEMHRFFSADRAAVVLPAAGI